MSKRLMPNLFSSKRDGRVVLHEPSFLNRLENENSLRNRDLAPEGYEPQQDILFNTNNQDFSAKDNKTEDDDESQKTVFDIMRSNENKSLPVVHDINDQTLSWGSTQVIIDIDDTIKSSGGYSLFNVQLGGIDTQYERGELYPGSFQFILELSTYKMGSRKKPLMLAVLTTRIQQVPITSDSLLNMRFKQVGERRGFKNWGIDCDNKILYSTVKEWVWNDTRGQKKFVNFKRLHKFVSDQNQDVRYIWIGDTGDRDLEAGEMMIKHFPGRIKAVFMHYVNQTNDAYGSFTKSIPNDYYLKSVPVVFFRTYVGAARKALEHGLMNHNALSRVIVQAVNDLNECKDQCSSKWKDLMKDVIEAEEAANLRRYNAKIVQKTREIINNKIKEIAFFDRTM